MLLSIPQSSTSKIIQFPIFDSSSTTGSLLAGLVFNSAGLTAYYNREGAAGAATAITLVTATKGTWTSSGFVAVDGANMPGWYELHIPNAALASGAKSVSIHLKGATNMVPVPILIELTATSNQDAAAGGMTALDAAISSRMASYTQPTGFLAATFPATVASTTNITAATGIVLSGVTHTGAVIPTVSAVTGLTASNLDATITSRMASYTQPTGFLAATFPGTVASTTNITAGTITTATNLTNLPAITSNWLTAAGIAAGALNGKGDWNIGKTGYSLTQTFPTNFASMVITAGGIVDADVEAVTGDTGAATKLKRVLSGNTTGTVGSGSTTTSIVTSSTNPAANVTNQFKGLILKFDDATTTAALRGQGTDITASTAAGVLTVTELTTAAVSGDIFTIS